VSGTGEQPSGRRPERLRSLLFVPADQPALLAKVPRSRPDAVVVDLEDAVAPSAKHDARETLLGTDLSVAEAPVLVRVNALGGPDAEADLEVVRSLPVAGVLLPKAERPEDVQQLRARLDDRHPEAVVVAGLETAAGVAGAQALLGERVDYAYFGAEDFIADLGGRRSAEGREVLFARSAVVLAGRLCGVPVVDQAVMRLEDDAFLADAESGRDLGYAGKLCIHPRQVALAHRVFTPTAEEVAAAEQVLAAAAQGVAVVDGSMVDAVHVRLAHAVLRRAGAA
jgi:citrate lyase subunit beta / citryl-CoA lyase